MQLRLPDRRRKVPTRPRFDQRAVAWRRGQRPAAVRSDHFAIELVIQTASGLLTGRFAPREALTILASQAPQARSEARVLAEREPRRSEGYAQLLTSIGAELATTFEATAQPVDLRAVVVELERVVRELAP